MGFRNVTEHLGLGVEYTQYINKIFNMDLAVFGM